MKYFFMVAMFVFLFSKAGDCLAEVGYGLNQPVRTTVQGTPVYSFGSTYILGQCPDFTL